MGNRRFESTSLPRSTVSRPGTASSNPASSSAGSVANLTPAAAGAIFRAALTSMTPMSSWIGIAEHRKLLACGTRFAADSPLDGLVVTRSPDGNPDTTSSPSANRDLGCSSISLPVTIPCEAVSGAKTPRPPVRTRSLPVMASTSRRHPELARRLSAIGAEPCTQRKGPRHLCRVRPVADAPRARHDIPPTCAHGSAGRKIGINLKYFNHST